MHFQRLSLQPTARLGYVAAYIADFKLRRVRRHQQDMGHSSNQLSRIHNSIFFRVNTYNFLYFKMVNILL
jgi:hypothetical protein